MQHWTKTIFFEQPVNEHTRVCLRLEHLFQRIHHHVLGETPWHSRVTLESLLDVVNILERPDLKALFTKELSRHQGNLARLEQIPQVDHEKLLEVLDELNKLTDILNTTNTKLANGLRENEFLNSVRQHLMNPGGASNFDNPAYHLWLQQAPTIRQQFLTTWVNEVENIDRTVKLHLRLVRDSSVPEYKTAPQGFYQMAMDPKSPCHLIRVGLSSESVVYPEISVGPHRINVRFLKSEFRSRPQQYPEDVLFKLTCCVF